MATSTLNLYARYPYRLRIDGLPQAAFSEVQMQVDTVKFLRGVSTSPDYCNWCQVPNADPITLELRVYDGQGKEISVWQIEGCRPNQFNIREIISDMTFIDVFQCRHEGFSQIS